MKEYFLCNPLPLGGFGGKFFHWAIYNLEEPYGSWGNGAAMRISPVAYVGNSEMEVKLLSQIVTGTTHNDPEGLKGGEVTALAVFKALHGATKEEIQEWYDPIILGSTAWKSCIRLIGLSQVVKKQCQKGCNVSLKVKIMNRLSAT